MSTLHQQTCTPCRGDEPTLTQDEIDRLIEDVPGWDVIERSGVLQLRRSFRFDDFASALRFTNAVGTIAEEAGHHPAILTQWGRATVRWWTHAIGGLHMNDFIMAARTDRLPI